MYIIFDTETTGLPKRYDASIQDIDNWPRSVQLAWQIHDKWGDLVEQKSVLIKPDGFDIPYDSEQIHGISTALAQAEGLPLRYVLEEFNLALSKASFVVGQNVDFDVNIMGAEFYRAGIETPLQNMPVLDTCTEQTAKLCQILGGRGGGFKLPTLSELHDFLFKEVFNEAHNASADVEATARCFLELLRKAHYSEEELNAEAGYVEAFQEKHPSPFKPIGIKHANLKQASKVFENKDKLIDDKPSRQQLDDNLENLADQAFVHLHNHSQYSILQSTMSVQDLIRTASEQNMPAVALTDHANMMGAFHFVNAAKALKKTTEDGHEQLAVKPIIGCEFFVCENHLDRSHKDNGYQIIMLAKTKKGYHNIAKMSSIAYTKGFYYVPRIDKKIVEQYKQDLIVLSGNLYGEIPSKILNVGEKQAEEALLWWKSQFGEDFYIEINRHQQEDENRANQSLIKLAKKHDVELVATNNVYYEKQEDANAHDVLLCVKEGEKQSTPIGRGRGYRFGLPNNEYYFKSAQDMKEIFKDYPEAIANTKVIADKIEFYDLARDVLLPKFEIPSEFVNPEDDKDQGKRGENAYLKQITFVGAEERYGEVKDSIKERLDFELSVIAKTGYPGYFLIVEDLIREARNMGVSVGPGRGSAAGSVVAYCLKITNIDPIKYNLLFERFLNPDRVSMPDIDIDFDDEGRSRVMDYVIKKYGKNQVAQIITYGTMAAKSAIRDTARVLDLPLYEADRIAKLVPDMTKLSKIFGKEEKELRDKFRSEDIDKILQLLQISENVDDKAQTVNQARIIEGSVRNTGVHACGVIITPDDITNFVPVATAKDSDLYLTQFDNNVVESAGLLKMDFLGLKTLTLIKDTVKIIKARHGKSLDPEQFPLDDTKTYELFQRGETVGIFQYESPGMQKHMKDLKPTVFEDLIAMNALYRPGPMEYIPSFIKRKHGEEQITYDLPEMEDILKETYGITVYQEQVMLLSQKLADFTKGEADVLRKAMGKKLKDVLAKLKPKFINNAITKGFNETILEKIWKDWEAFASYAFNKSHSTCYAFIAYQTAFLKAHYPAEYMAAVLSNNMSDIKKVTFFMEECRRMGIEVLGPDVNESFYQFSVNKNNAIRFGMGAVKGVGRNAVETIVENRKADGDYKSIFDFAKRIDLRAANKKAFESLALAGAFDNLGNVHRAQFFHKDEGSDQIFLEKIIKYASRYQDNKNSAQVSLFGDSSEVQIPEPIVPPCEPWHNMKTLKLEKEVVGLFLSAHPLDDFKLEMKHYCNTTLKAFSALEDYINKDLKVAGVITDVNHKVSINGKGYATFVLEDYKDSHEFWIFGEEYLKYRHYLIPDHFIHLKIRPTQYTNRETGEPSRIRTQYLSFKQLQDVIPEFSKRLKLMLDIEKVDEDTVEKLSEVCLKYKGSKTIDVVLYDRTNEIKLNTHSKSKQVEINTHLLTELQSLELNYKLN